jgi:hypothetical protein
MFNYIKVISIFVKFYFRPHNMKNILFFFFLLPLTICSQNADFRSLNITEATDAIKIDGVLEEKTWNTAEVANEFWMKFPTNDSKSKLNTEVKLSYDKNYLYVGIKAFEISPKIVLSSLKRDVGLREGDGVGLVLDPIGQKSNGFYFSISPYNTQTEGLILGNDEDITFTWDNKWFSSTKVYDGYWTAELAIPFSILRYDDAKKAWGINFIRSNRKSNEFHTWSQIPLQFRGTDLGYTGTLVWDKEPPQAGRAFSINPYVLTSINDEISTNTQAKANAGVDAKLSLSSALNLDLTINPDFSNVDVDRQVTNLSRFSIFFPERRVFFLENDDLFSGYGIPPIRPFYSRRIGSKDGQSVPIYFGARLTGNISKNSRIGIMNIQTGRKGSSSADNFTSVSLNQRVLSRSTFKAYFNNRNAQMNDAERIANPFDVYGRNVGSEFNYSNQAGTINGWGGLHYSLKPGITEFNNNVSLGGGYSDERFSSFIDYNKLGRNFYADMGFVNRIENYDSQRDTTIRVGSEFLYNETEYKINYKNHSYFNRISFSLENFLAYDQDKNFNERNNSFEVMFLLKNASNFSLNYENMDVNLLFPFKFVDNDLAKPLPSGRYAFSNFGVEFSSDTRKNLFFKATGKFGSFYGADFQQIAISITGRKQPFVSFGVDLEYNKLLFSDIYGGKEEFLLVAPKLEWNFSNSLFWTNFIQYNTQAKNFNINSRLQWRYQPMSDLFLVYSDDYLVDTKFQNNTRGLVLKVNYWLNGKI